ncbi:VOC family protein [Nonomuraea sp. KM90]|uniref:VOC family protein n=1 Tax=Nonomuraea sp. KM90 TaxID=3457428 RepID=UPI003FCD81CE
MRSTPLFQKIDAVIVPVPDLDSGLRFYQHRLGHELLWRNDQLGQAGLGLPDSDAEIVLDIRLNLAPTWLVRSADEAASEIVAAGGRVVADPSDIPVGRVAIVADPFGNELVLVDLSKGRYVTDPSGTVIGVAE